ncbi:hypothetical protein [Salinarimonas sp.]|uniref:hypothetical protein n=1 Tax=Salinarimonas sp. TaxID=2766526 RepID=UPI0032D9AB76
MRRVEAGEPDLRRRDTLSALRVVADRLGRAPDEIPATATAIRALFDEHGLARLGVNERRYADIRARGDHELGGLTLQLEESIRRATEACAP